METLTLPKNGFKMPDQPNKSGKARRKTKYLNLQHSSTTTDGSEAASQEEEGVKRCENKEYFVVDCAKEQIWTKFLKDFEFVVKEEDSLYTAVKHLGLGLSAVNLQLESLTADGKSWRAVSLSSLAEAR